MNDTLYTCKDVTHECESADNIDGGCYHRDTHMCDNSCSSDYCSKEEMNIPDLCCIPYVKHKVDTKDVYTKVNIDTLYAKCPKSNTCTNDECSEKHKHYHKYVYDECLHFKIYDKCPGCEIFIKSSTEVKKVNNRLKRLIDFNRKQA